jgi:hypothetical protein
MEIYHKHTDLGAQIPFLTYFNLIDPQKTIFSALYKIPDRPFYAYILFIYVIPDRQMTRSY